MVDATVTLYKDIGLDSNYNRTMLFDTKIQQTNWFNSISTNLKLTLTNVNYNKIQNALYVHEQFGDIYGYSYARLQDIDDSGRTYYGFISGVTLVDDETTRFDIVIDPIQTFMTEWELGKCLVNREHCDRWSASSTSPIRLAPLKEGVVGNNEIEFDYEYYDKPVYYQDPSTRLNVEMSTMVVVFSKEIWYGTPQDNYSVTQIMYGVIPIGVGDTEINPNLSLSSLGDITTIRPVTMDEVINGSWVDKLGINPDAIFGAYICNQFSIPFYGGTSDNVCTGAYGKYTASATNTGFKLLEGGGLDAIYEDGTFPAVVSFSTDSESDTIDAIQCLTEEEVLMAYTSGTSFVVNIPVPSKPSDGDIASDTHEPQLYMSPFRCSYLTDSAYTPLMTVPDVVRFTPGNKDIGVYTLLKSTGITNYMTFEDKQNGVIGGSTMLPANSIDVLSDAWKSYCLTQRDSDRRMMWSNIITNTINQAVFMGYGGALVGSRSASGDWDDDERRNTLLKRGAVGATTLAVGASFVTSAVQGYQMWQQQDAKEQAIRNTPSTLTAQSDGVALGLTPVRMVSTKIDDIDYNIAYEKFRYYGYVVNAMETPNIKTRKYFNYICTSNTTIKGALPADIKQSLVSIFEKGITFFHADNCDDTNYPTNTSGEELENIERSLL